MDIIRRVGQAFVRRIISTVRDARHGGSLLVVPPLRTADVCGGGLVTVKYVFKDAEPRRRFRTLILAVLRELSEQAIEAGRPIGWEEYASSHAPAIVELDEAIMEMAHLVSALADVDGLVVMTQRFEVLGFGGVVSGQLPEIAAIAQAINLEGTERIEEPTDGMGTRHRAAYRAVAAMPDALCVVISQDGCCPSRYSNALRPCCGVTEGCQFLTVRGPVEKREERAESGKGSSRAGCAASEGPLRREGRRSESERGRDR
jgi:hypothetical protein